MEDKLYSLTTQELDKVISVCEYQSEKIENFLTKQFEELEQLESDEDKAKKLEEINGLIDNRTLFTVLIFMAETARAKDRDSWILKGITDEQKVKNKETLEKLEFMLKEILQL
ncbi:hypothetical protein LJC10_05430 [Selenomonadales bacterium OttesenSCG-928-I06]|nr:hypothetical protein [Selenomonadales bacterium OttesenSCG-928-I06]